jgi:hypothetical protein
MGHLMSADTNYDTNDFVASRRSAIDAGTIQPTPRTAAGRNGFLSSPRPPTNSFASQRYSPQPDKSF